MEETLTFGDIQIPGPLATSLFFKPVFFDEDIRKTYKVFYNVITKKKLVYAQTLEKIVRKWTGANFSAAGNTLNLVNRELSVERMNINLLQNTNDFYDTIMEYALETGTKIQNIDGLVLDILMTRVQEATRKDIMRIGWYGDITSSDANYNMVDGFFKKITLGVNAGTINWKSSGSGTALNPGDAIALLEQVWINQPTVLKALPNAQKQFRISPDILYNYMTTLEDGRNEYGYQLIEAGKPTGSYYYRGIELIPEFTWEAENIAAGNPNKHQVVLTSPLNLCIGTDVVSPGDEILMGYDQYRDNLWLKSNFKFGVDYVFDELFSVAY